MEKTKRELLDDELKSKYEVDALKRKQEKVRKEFEYLHSIDTLHFQSEFLKAQAKEICKYYNRIKLTPFKSWESSLRNMIEDESFLFDHYIKVNEYGELELDIERLDALILESLSPEDLAKNMF